MLHSGKFVLSVPVEVESILGWEEHYNQDKLQHDVKNWLVCFFFYVSGLMYNICGWI